MNFSRFAPIAALAVTLSACSTATSFAPTAIAANTASSLQSWQRSLAQKGLPGAGCFKATYPAVQWKKIACAAPPHLWFPVPASRRKGPSPNVGDGRDYTADTSPNLISTAIGAFPTAKGVKSVQSVGCCGEQGLNSYSLQLNSDFFQTAACGGMPNCVGWEQFVYSNPPAGQGALFIQDWLVSTQGSFSSCPPSAGWENVGIGCVQNSPYAVYLPNVSATHLNQVVETGVASSGGDSIYLAVGRSEYGMQNVQSDGITDLAQHWEGAEFNIIGNGGGDVADFKGKSEVTVSLQTDTGVTTAPTCPANTGTTGESNNLFFVTAPKKAPSLEYPSIEFTMKSKTGGKPSCDAESGT